MSKYFILGCSCGHRIQISTEENRTEIRCQQCHRYIRVPKLVDLGDTSSQNRLVGKILEKRYRIDAHLADGAMGRVYRATDLVLNIPVAIKVLKPYLIPEHQEKRFLNEAKIASELVHPGIIMVRNLHRTKKGIHFMVMDFCPGQSLRNILELQPRLPIPQVIEIGRQILSALEVAHDKGVIHRDIKPANIMIEETKEGTKVRVLDFGIAKVFSDAGGFVCESLTRTGFIIGTTRYMAPEQVVKGKMGKETDIYAVAALMYHLITGTPPFNDGTREQILKNIVRKNPTPLQEIAKKQKIGIVPKLLDLVILKALNKDPKQRFHCASQFIQALGLCKSKTAWSSLLACQIVFQTYWVRCRSKIRMGIVISTIAFLLLVPSAYFLYQSMQNNFYQEQANKMMSNREYYQAYSWLQKITNHTPALQQQKKMAIMQSLGKCLQQQDYTQIDFLLTQWKQENQSQENGNSFSYELLSDCIREEKTCLQIQRLLANKKWLEASSLIQSPIPRFLQSLNTRAEIADWIEKYRE